MSNYYGRSLVNHRYRPGDGTNKLCWVQLPQPCPNLVAVVLHASESDGGAWYRAFYGYCEAHANVKLRDPCSGLYYAGRVGVSEVEEEWA